MAIGSTYSSRQKQSIGTRMRYEGALRREKQRSFERTQAKRTQRKAALKQQEKRREVMRERNATAANSAASMTNQVFAINTNAAYDSNSLIIQIVQQRQAQQISELV